MPRVGLISDTHGFLDPQVLPLLAGVDHIIHAGDIGWPKIILELEGVAPVTAVSGNTDHGLPYRETELVAVGGLKFLVHHIVDPRRLTDELRRRVAQTCPDVVVYGHTHESSYQLVEGVRFINPGSAGKARFGRPRTLAIVGWTAGPDDLQVDFHELGA